MPKENRNFAVTHTAVTLNKAPASKFHRRMNAPQIVQRMDEEKTKEGAPQLRGQLIRAAAAVTMQILQQI